MGGVAVLFGALAIAAGIGVGAYFFYRSAQTGTSGVNKVAARIDSEGLLGALFPKGNPRLRPASGGYTDPAAYGQAVKDLTTSAIAIQQAVSKQQALDKAAQQQGGGSGGGVGELFRGTAGEGISGSEYLRQLQQSEPPNFDDVGGID